MKTKISVVKQDITKLSVDIIVNAANTSLLGGGGVDGAIHRAGGPQVLSECRKIVSKQGGCKTGEAVITTAGELSAKYIIHTVGPVWNGGKKNEEQLLRSCYLKSLQLATEYEAKSIAFPNISTGIYRFPKELAAQIAVESVVEFSTQNPVFEEIIFACLDDINFNVYHRLLFDTD
ncbi:MULTISPECIES: O-acetyl-ADP-ribose deacetylase [Brevibacillus]|uniref:O-acetyl-ADP-ribose deacetylase n=1 Tax=Brevibacillus TaxID=55080 RepID=UPI000D106BAF|nr:MULTISPECIES: O-acetyl-ADP-ribose deacetylase [Brevibacillus]PSJ65084.1 O-acetyl-ADP-ribose deacetylase [Brevibacillus brevis]RED21297.1 O-acetyl-ADP-ribose deacetylase (regulator of RNase III) [Brevibacillus brevis]TQK42029.1 O-acetyl-ADP-ribose deacetylase (regulator of RNase III) [Brevibacillus sp. AG162]VEF91989.1 O-acetyl-ADP-ribose deacetylase [Brevibacillus brevis]GEC91645.1 macro domain-containing protein [Brevibacillus brevis]